MLQRIRRVSLLPTYSYIIFLLINYTTCKVCGCFERDNKTEFLSKFESYLFNYNQL